MNRYIQKKKNYTLNLNKKNASIKKSRYEDDVFGEIDTLIPSIVGPNTLRSRGPLILNDFSSFSTSTGDVYGSIANCIVTSAPDATRTDGTYPSVSQTSRTGYGVNATFYIETTAFGTSVSSITAGGDYYKVGDQITISNTNIGGTGSDLVIEVTKIIPKDYEFTTLTATGGSGTGAQYTVLIQIDGTVLVKATTAGTEYELNDVLTINTVSVGNITTTVLKTNYTNLYTNVATTGGSGSNATLNVTINQDGSYSALINNRGSGYKVGDNITVDDANIGNNGAVSIFFKVSVLDLRDLEFVWNLPSMNLSKNAKLYVSNVSNLNAVSTYLYTISCKEVNGSQTWNSNNGYPLIYCEKGFVSPNNVNIEHSLSNPESMNTLTFYMSDDINVKQGINSDIDFMITIVISDYDEEKVDSNIMRMVKPEHYTDKKFPL